MTTSRHIAPTHRLSDVDRGILAEEPELPRETVETDATEIAIWPGSADEMHAVLRNARAPARQWIRQGRAPNGRMLPYRVPVLAR